jgi:hypothetical protein
MTSIMTSIKVSPQHQRGRGLAARSRIVIGAARNLAKTRALIEPKRRNIMLVDFQKYRTRSKSRQTAQMKIEQPARKSMATLAAGNRH